MTAKSPPLLRRAEATAAIPDILRAVDEINGTRDLYVRVTRLAIFGSYLSDRDPIGDLDIAAQIDSRLSPIEMMRRPEAMLSNHDWAVGQLQVANFVEVTDWTWLQFFDGPWVEIYPNMKLRHTVADASLVGAEHG